MTPVLLQYVIYDHPLDYPENFVIRRWGIFENIPDPVIDERFLVLTTSLEGARHWIKHTFPELVRIARDPTDEPQIVETWT